MHTTWPSLFDVLLIVGAVAAFAHGAVALALTGYRRDWTERGRLFFWSWQTWDSSNYTEAGKRLCKWLPTTCGIGVASALMALLVLMFEA